VKKLVVDLKLPGWGAILGKPDLTKVKLPYIIGGEPVDPDDDSSTTVYGSFTLASSDLPSSAPHPGSFKFTTSFFIAFNHWYKLGEVAPSNWSFVRYQKELDILVSDSSTFISMLQVVYLRLSTVKQKIWKPMASQNLSKAVNLFNLEIMS